MIASYLKGGAVYAKEVSRGIQFVYPALLMKPHCADVWIFWKHCTFNTRVTMYMNFVSTECSQGNILQPHFPQSRPEQVWRRASSAHVADAANFWWKPATFRNRKDSDYSGWEWHPCGEKENQGHHAGTWDGVHPRKCKSRHFQNRDVLMTMQRTSLLRLFENPVISMDTA